jgi:hypothetical protein
MFTAARAKDVFCFLLYKLFHVRPDTGQLNSQAWGLKATLLQACNTVLIFKLPDFLHSNAIFFLTPTPYFQFAKPRKATNHHLGKVALRSYWGGGGGGARGRGTGSSDSAHSCFSSVPRGD